MNKVLLLLQAFSSLADAAFENAQPTSEDDEEPTTYALSKKFEFIVQKIIQTGDRLVWLSWQQQNQEFSNKCFRK